VPRRHPDGTPIGSFPGQILFTNIELHKCRANFVLQVPHRVFTGATGTTCLQSDLKDGILHSGDRVDSGGEMGMGGHGGGRVTRVSMVLAVGAVALAVVGAATSSGGTRPTVAAAPAALSGEQASTSSYSFGINAHPDHNSGPRALRALGASLARVEWTIGAPTTSMGAIIGAYASAGVKVQPLAAFVGRLPSQGEAMNLRAWALRFGPKGTFWKRPENRSRYAITRIEFGNETSYGYQYGDSYSDQSYADRAAEYARRAKDAAIALRGTGVGLLIQGEDGGSIASHWVDRMFEAVPDLGAYAAGWTVHPYGPDGNLKIDRMLSHLQYHGVSRSTAKIYITEWGLASDDGKSLDDNYGYPVNMTFADAARTLADVVATWRGRYGSNLAQIIIYQDYESRSAGQPSANREHFFGIFRPGRVEKGDYTAEVRRQILAAR
jgi:hypothetical protein